MSSMSDLLLGRLAADDDLGERPENLVLAAMTDDLDSVLGGQEPKEPERTDDAGPPPRGAWLRSIEVEGFRGIGPSVSLELAAGPGLHLVCGRNGSGKSSFSEAAELLLTDSCSRWDGRNRPWREAWQNLHHSGPTKLAAELAIDGLPRCVRVEAEWEPGSDPADRRIDRVTGGDGLARRADLGWSRHFETWKPFLSYNELGNLLDESPTRLHDTLASVLGLEFIAVAIGRLEQKRKELREVTKLAREELKVIRRSLTETDDERAAACLEALPEKKKWKVDVVEDLVTGAGPVPAGLDRLRRLATIHPLDEEKLGEAVEDLREAAEGLAEARTDQDTSLALRVADLLDGAARWFDEQAGDGVRDCPVCGTPEALDGAWREKAAKEVDALRELARKLEDARLRVDGALEAARSLTSPVLDSADGDGELVGEEVAAALRASWEAFAKPPTDGEASAWADHLDRTGPAVLRAAAALRQAADERQKQLADTWRPVAKLVAGWLDKARPAQAAEKDGKDLKAAADWLSSIEEELRNERFEPIKHRAQEIWELLRARSNVSLDDLRFAGSRNRRRIEMEVSVDGQPGVALGVMSQGELHSLALALFLPRTTLPESPFRFLLIDDPVQAMDPVKVEGLARVLERVAKTHQVVVFTHDDRLSEAVRRLRIAARLREVHRRPGSLVEVRASVGPVHRLFDDAHAIVRDERLPAGVRDRVAAGLCRQALEARVQEVVRRRRLDRGEGHLEVEELLAQPRKFLPSLGLALFDEDGRGGEVYSRLDAGGRRFGPTAAKVAKECNSGSHGHSIGATPDFVRACQRLADGLDNLP